MSIFKKSAPAAVKEVVAATKSPSATPGANPPWHVEGCLACKASPGINSQGNPCMACNHVQKRRKAQGGAGVTVDDVEVYHAEDGTLRWRKKDEMLPQGVAAVREVPAEEPAEEPTLEPEPAPAPAPKPKVEEGAAQVVKPAKTKRKQAAVPVVEPTLPKVAPPLVEQPKANVPASARITDEQVDRKEERERQPEAAPAEGFELLIGALPVGERVIDLNDVLRAFGGADYYSRNAFERRDEVARQVDEIVSDLEGLVVVVTDQTPDLTALLAVLTPRARRVVRSIR